MDVLSWSFCLLAISGSLTATEIQLGTQVESALAKQDYDIKYIPKIIRLTKTDGHALFFLSDGSQWRSIEGSDASPTWKVGDRVMVRWDHDRKEYFFHDSTRDPLFSKRRKEISEGVTMVDAPSTTISHVDHENRTVTLSDGTSLKWVPFIGELEEGNRAFLSLNEGKETSIDYPYFLIGLVPVVDSFTHEVTWQPHGETPGRLLSK